MIERAYTVWDIERMRCAVDWLHRPNGPYLPEARRKEIEELLRTYMLNGTDPDELEAAANSRNDTDITKWSNYPKKCGSKTEDAALAK